MKIREGHKTNKNKIISKLFKCHENDKKMKEKDRTTEGARNNSTDKMKIIIRNETSEIKKRERRGKRYKA